MPHGKTQPIESVTSSPTAQGPNPKIKQLVWNTKLTSLLF